MISQNCQESIKDAVRIEEVIGDFVTLQKKGASLWGCCPFHNEKSPSFSVSPEKGIYKCFGCGVSGDAIKYLMEAENKDYPEALEYLAGKYNILLEHDQAEHPEDKEKRVAQGAVLAAANRAWQNALWEQLDKHVPDYDFATDTISTFPIAGDVGSYIINNRGLELEDIVAWGIGYAPNESKFLTGRVINSGSWEPAYQLGIVKSQEGSNYDAFRNRLMIPIHNHKGQLVGFGARTLELDPEKSKKYGKWINSTESIRFNKRKLLFGLYQALQSKAIKDKGFAILVEGYTDAIMMHKVGFENTVASCGTSLTPEQAQLLARFTNHVVVLYDGDKAGDAASRAAVRILLAEGLKVTVVRLPLAHDPDSYCLECFAKQDETNSAFELVKGYIDAKSVDGVMWSANTLLEKAGDEPDDKAMAVDMIAQMLALITHAVKRSGYIDLLNKKYKLSKKLLADAIAAELGELEAAAKKSQPDDPWGLQFPEDADKEMFSEFGVFESQKCTYFATSGGYGKGANFTLRCEYLLERQEGEPVRVFRLENYAGYKKMLALPIKALSSVPTFQTCVESLGNFIYEKGQPDLNRWKQILYSMEKRILEIDTLGHFAKGGFYAFANGIFIYKTGKWQDASDEGIVEHDGQNYFIRANSIVEFESNEGMEFERRFRHKPTDTTFHDWTILMQRVYGEHAILAINHFIAAVFRDIVFSRFSIFPHLFLFGPPASGKSQVGESLVQMFGDMQEKFNLSAGTKVGFQRKFAQFNNSEVWFDEYSNNIDIKIVDGLKGAYDGSGHEKGVKSQDNRTMVTKIKSAAIISGQQLPTADPALFTRTQLLQFVQRDDWDVEAYDRLKRAEKEGLTSVLLQVLGEREYFEDRFNQEFDQALVDFRQVLSEKYGDIKIDDRLMKNYLIGYVCWKILHNRLNFAFTAVEEKETYVKRMVEHSQLISTGADVATFWQITNSLFKNVRIKEGEDFHIGCQLVDGVEVEFVAMRLQTVHQEYMKEFKAGKSKAEGMELNSLMFYLKGSPEFIEYKSSHRFGSNGVNTSALLFDYQALQRKYSIILERPSVDPMAATGNKDSKLKVVGGSDVKDDLPF